MLRALWAGITGWVQERTKDWGKTEWAHAGVILLIVIGAVVHQCILWNWYIEDAAISFAYAKHLAMGEGLVPYIGAERVEGYSNPAWVFFLAPFSWVVDLHAAARWIQVVMCVPTVLWTWFAARELLGERSHLTLVAPAVLAASAQFAVWSGAGLEMALMNLLMAGAIWRTLVELRTGRWPWSALLWFGVAISRPEAILYAAVAGFCAMVFQLHARRGLAPTLRWLITFFLPFGLYHAWRYNYFAWELPNTYYGKLERRPEFPLLAWSGKSWKYTRDFMYELGWGFFLPVWVLGVLGDRRWRLPVAMIACLVMGLTIDLGTDQRFLLGIVVAFLLAVFWLGLRYTEDDPPRWLPAIGLVVAAGIVLSAEVLRYRYAMSPNPIPTPEWMASAPPWVLIGLGLLLPLLSSGSQAWQGRVLTWLLCCATILFALIAQWDWMTGFRWYAPAVVPGALLFGLGTASAAHVVQATFSRVTGRLTWPGYATAVILVLLTVPANVWHTRSLAMKPQTEPRDVLHRVRFVDGVRDRLHVDERWIDLDVDMGAHLFWSDFEMIDIAGLIDVPLAHHKFERAFVKEYLFEEKRPHFAHVHGGWASSSRILTYPEFKEGYVVIPGYIANKTQFHIGNHVRRDLIVADAWPHGDRRVALSRGVVLHGVVVPSEPAPGFMAYVEIGISAPTAGRAEGDDFRVILFATNDRGVLHSWELPPGYDWLFPHEWEPDEVWVGRFDLRVPEELTPGSYDLGVVVIGGDGTVLAPVSPDAVPEGVHVGRDLDAPPAFARGEVVFEDALVVLSKEERDVAADADLEAALAASARNRCDEAEQDWFLARKHRPVDSGWQAEHRPDVNRALASCYARGADVLDRRSDKVAALVRARELDHWAPEYRRRARPLAQQLYAEGLEARTAEDWKLAYRLFADAVDVDRSRSWARRYAEEARAYRLEIDDDTLARKAEEKEQERQNAQKLRREAAEKRRARDPGPPAPEPDP